MVHVFETTGPAKRYFNRKQAEYDAKKLCRKTGQTVAVLEVVHAVRPQVEVIEESQFEVDPQVEEAPF